MFDAKSILEALVKGAAPQAAPQSSGGGDLGGLGDILGQLAGAGGKGGSGGGLGGLGDILGQLAGAGGGSTAPGRNVAPSGGGLGDILGKLGGGGQGSHAAPAGAGDGLGDILGQLQKQLGGAGGAGGLGGLGGLGDILGQVLGQAKEGAREGAGKLNEATGAGDALGRISRELAGKSPDEILATLKELMANNQMGAGAALGGLGALVLGTKTGRSLASTAVKLGALALIGGLAYKAVQNYQAGKPLVAHGQGGAASVLPAPKGSGYEPDAVTHDSATLLIRAMIAAAAADGRIDAQEQARIIGGLGQANLGPEAEEFLANAMNNPASASDLAAEVTTPEQAVQVYTAARIAIDARERSEATFLSDLAAALGMDAELVAHIEDQAQSVATSAAA
jgi:uncharacterized membrane protein YebE (DUF533 family)